MTLETLEKHTKMTLKTKYIFNITNGKLKRSRPHCPSYEQKVIFMTL